MPVLSSNTPVRGLRPAATGSLFARFLLILLITLSGTMVSAVVAPVANAAGPRLTAFDNRMLELVNAARGDAGLAELQSATGLTNLSLWWSGQLADGATSNVLQHNPNAFQQTLNYGASNRTSWAENVAKWSPVSVTADAIFNAYWNSPGHKANILGASYRYVGIASVTGSNGVSWNTMTFTDKVDPGQVYVPPAPVGSVDAVAVASGFIRVTGWSYDPSATSTSIPVHVYVNGAGVADTADVSRPDVNSVMGVTGAHGFDISVAAQSGSNQVCIYALSVTGAANTTLSCSTVTWTPLPTPVGSLDSVTMSAGVIQVAGWTYDPNSTSASIPVHVYVNGAGAAVLNANGSRPDVNTAMSVSGNHGFTGSASAVTGTNQVCLYAISVSGASNTTLGCTTLTYSPNAFPSGAVDTVTRSGSTVRVSGWAYDPRSSATSIPVHVYVNGAGTALTANGARGDVNAAFSISGNHGYDAVLSSPTPNVQVCIYAISVTGGSNATLTCRTV